MECKVLRLSLAKDTDLRATLEHDCISLRFANENVQKVTKELCERLEAYTAEVCRMDQLTADLMKRDQLHVAELTKKKERRAEEEYIAEDLWRQIAATKTEQVDLRSRIAELTDAHRCSWQGVATHGGAHGESSGCTPEARSQIG